MSSAESLESQQLYSLLGDERRRYTVHYLKQQGDTVSVSDLAERVAAWENGKTIDELTTQERKRVYISLYQSHLPTLDEQGIVEYDAERKSVKLSPAMRNRKIYLEIVPRGTIPWGLYYLGLGFGSVVLLVVLSFELRPLTAIPILGWAGMIVTTLLISSAMHILQTRQPRLGDEVAPPDRDAK